MASRISRSIHQSRPLIIDYDEGPHERDAENRVLIHPRETPSIILIKASDSAPRIETANNSCPITLLRPQTARRARLADTPELHDPRRQKLAAGILRIRARVGEGNPRAWELLQFVSCRPSFFSYPRKEARLLAEIKRRLRTWTCILMDVLFYLDRGSFRGVRIVIPDVIPQRVDYDLRARERRGEQIFQSCVTRIPAMRGGRLRS